MWLESVDLIFLVVSQFFLKIYFEFLFFKEIVNVSRIFCEFVFLPFSPILFCRLFLVQFLIKNNHVADFTMK